ncbi:MAG: DUF420 domain-containing protein [Acidobacteria bacterium]|nr:DUF420 domain-containing protein [Acidobacteriota bacterium]MBV9479860.1 DUF420 domain-containing protein [Acidobacteriota bacterium]
MLIAPIEIPQPFAMFPALNATLNGTSAVLLVTGRWFIVHGRWRVHRAFMIAALITSLAFLSCYVYFHAHVGSVQFAGKGWSRPLYFTILVSHTILAAAIVPLIAITLSRALRRSFQGHRMIARWTFPLWLYVSVTGVVIYLMLYRI